MFGLSIKFQDLTLKNQQQRMYTYFLFIKSLDNYFEIFMTWNNKMYLINSYIMILQYSGIKGLLLIFNCCSSVLLTTTQLQITHKDTSYFNKTVHNVLNIVYLKLL